MRVSLCDESDGKAIVMGKAMGQHVTAGMRAFVIVKPLR